MNSDFSKPKPNRGDSPMGRGAHDIRRTTLSRMRPAAQEPNTITPSEPTETPQPQPVAIQPQPHKDILDEIDMSDPTEVAIESPEKPDNKQPKEPRKSLKERLITWAKTRTKKQWIIIGVIAFVVLGLLVAGGILLFGGKDEPVKKATITKKIAAPKPTTIASTLSGLQVAPEVNNRPVTGVMIENSMDARPQAGLGQASVVFEAVAEGGITRFLALFQDTQPDYIGPVRSARPYYVQWASAFDATYAHVGGSPDALAKIKELGVKDLDQFANGNSYQRISSRYAPHNVYTSIAQLQDLAKSKGYEKSNYTGFARKTKEEPAATPTAKTIDMSISSYYFNVHYDYDQPTNTYKRSEGGTWHTDEKSGQIAPKVVIALAMPQSLASDGLHTVYNTLGTGQGMLFQDGKNTPITWSKTNDKSQFTFTDANGHGIKLNPGQTWVTIVSGMDKVTSAP